MLVLSILSGARSAQFRGLYLGIDLLRSTPIRWDYTRSPNTHVLVLGSSGSGKTHTLAALLYRFLKHRLASRALIIDLKGEYRDLLESSGLEYRVIDPSIAPLKLCIDIPRGVHLDLLLSALGIPSDAKTHVLRVLEASCESEYSIDLKALSKEFRLVDRYLELNDGLSLGSDHSIEILNLSSIPLRSAIPLSALAVGIALAKGGYAIVLDEAWHLVSTLEPELVSYVYRFARSYGCSLLIASQSVNDLQPDARIFFENSSLILCFASSSPDYWRRILELTFPSRRGRLMDLVTRYIDERGHCLAKLSYMKDPLFLYFDPLHHEL